MAHRVLIGRTVQKRRVALTAALGGIVGSVLDIAVLVLCVETGVVVPVAAFLGAAAGAGACFLANKYWAFRDPRPLTLGQVTSFGLVAVGTALLMALAMSVVAVGMGVPYLKAKAICAATVFLFWSYPAQRRFVFAHALGEPGFDDDVLDDLEDADPAKSFA